MPRKPTQQRAQATFDAIVEAGFVCVARHGVANTTTRHIADAAGVGVGSLYEYFANKEEVFAAMNRKFVADVVELVHLNTPRVVTLGVRDAVDMLARTFGDLLTRDDERYLKVAREVLQADLTDFTEPVNRALAELALRYVMNHPEYTRLRNLETMSYIFINAGVAVILRHLSSANPPVSYDALCTGLADLVESYVVRELERLDAAARGG